MTSFEIPNQRSYFNSYDHVTGIFEAPVDGSYQFHMSCDDSCKFLMSPETDPLNPDAKEVIIDRPYHTSFRYYKHVEDDVDAENFQADMFS